MQDHSSMQSNPYQQQQQQQQQHPPLQPPPQSQPMRMPAQSPMQAIPHMPPSMPGMPGMPGGASCAPPRNASFIRHFTQKCILLVSEELSKKETHDLLQTKVISPIINMLYVALFPYIMVTIVIIFIILLASLLTLVFFMLDHFRKRT